MTLLWEIVSLVETETLRCMFVWHFFLLFFNKYLCWGMILIFTLLPLTYSLQCHFWWHYLLILRLVVFVRFFVRRSTLISQYHLSLQHLLILFDLALSFFGMASSQAWSWWHTWIHPHGICIICVTSYLLLCLMWWFMSSSWYTYLIDWRRLLLKIGIISCSDMILSYDIIFYAISIALATLYLIKGRRIWIDVQFVDVYANIWIGSSLIKGLMQGSSSTITAIIGYKPVYFRDGRPDIRIHIIELLRKIWSCRIKYLLHFILGNRLLVLCDERPH
jgi:hypothetical protein